MAKKCKFVFSCILPDRRDIVPKMTHTANFAPGPISNMTLENFIAQDLSRPVPIGIKNGKSLPQMLAEALRKQAVHPDKICGILLYGSGLWDTDATPAAERIWDFHILVDHLKDFDRRLWPQLAGVVLPPNVYYKEIEIDGHVYGCKCNVMSLRQFEKQCSGRVVTPHIWARFAQPSRLVYHRMGQDKKNIAAAIAMAVGTFHKFALSYCGAESQISKIRDGRYIWHVGLGQTYSLELRSERPGRVDKIIDAAPDNFATRTQLWLKSQEGQETHLKKHPPAFDTPKRVFKKFIAFLRIIKSATTFDGGVDYALWKISRHSGITIHPTDFQRRHPFIAGWPILWRLWRAGALR